MTYTAMVEQIIKQQGQIIGPLAWRIAGRISGIEIAGETITLMDDSAHTVDLLVQEYAQLFGKASVEVCREAIQDLLRQLAVEDIPESLRN